jgi:hypothetical protein
MGRWEEGWEAFEARWYLTDRPLAFWQMRTGPLFTGKLADWRGKTVLLRCEQGWGDTIMFSRYIPLVAEVAAEVIVQAPPPVYRLMQRVDGVSRLYGINDVTPLYDYENSLMSLPGMFGTTPDTCPLPTDFKVPLATKPGGFLGKLPVKVGFCWQGGPRHEDPKAHAIDVRRSLPRESFRELMDIVNQHGALVQSLDYTDVYSMFGDAAQPYLPDWLDTAEIVAKLNLVITVDTAVAHLSASMGVETWLLSRFDGCWRWLWNRRDTPWYQSMYIYRQKRLGEWGPVLEQVAHDLKRWFWGAPIHDGPS